MIEFEELFGQPAETFKKTIILTPFLSKGLLEDLGIMEWCRGNPFSSGHGEDFTLVHTQIGAPFVGDATLYLENTSSPYLIFWGACGMVQSSGQCTLGSLVTPTHSFNCESFSHLLQKTIREGDWAEANTELTQEILKMSPEIQKVRCASFGSFKLEYDSFDFLKENNVDVVEMETSAFFNAAHHTKKKAAALFYVTDILKEKHVFAPMTPTQQTVMQIAQAKGAQILQKLSGSLVKSEL